MIGILETERLLLRAPMESDTEEMLAIRNSAFVQEFNAMKIIDAEKMRGQIVRDIEHQTAFYIVRKADDKLIGGIWMEDDNARYDVKSRYLSYYLGEPYARKGYMKEALGAVIGMLFECDPELEVVASSVFSENMASERLLWSLGFTREGCIRKAVRDARGKVHDDVQFSLLREEWEWIR